MSPSRVISARMAHRKQVEAFPYFAADMSVGRLLEEEGADDKPVAAQLSTPEEDAARLASVDQIIFTKLQDAERAAQDIARRAYEEGFASGEAEGRTFGESQFRVTIQNLQAQLQDMGRMGELLGRAAAEEILALSLAMAEYLAAQQIERSSESVRPLLTRVLEANPFPGAEGGRPMLVAALNPRDREALGRDFTVPGVAFQEDPALARGGLRLESPDGILDATLERRRARLLKLLQGLEEEALS